MDNDIRYDEERIGMIFSDIRRYVKDLDGLGIQGIGDLSDKRNFYAASMVLFSLLNRVFDLGSEMAFAHNLGIPATYRDIFVLLQKQGIIGNDLAHDMIGLVTYRNLLSHEYHGITGKTLFDLTKKVDCIRQFVDMMQDRIQHNQKE
ncbi:MAG: DUF86 domain-containing protein [Methanoregula sp.]|nr:DUF86 domain-containing protein [Methanoregula sp.]